MITRTAAGDAPSLRSLALTETVALPAAIDVVAEAAAARGARVVFCDNRPVPMPGEPDLDDAIAGLAEAAVSARA